MTVAVLLTCSLAVAGRAWARGPKPQPCPPGRYIVTQGAEAIVGDSAPRPAVVEVQGRQVGLGTHCPLSAGTVKTKKSGTIVKGHWASCGALQKVRLTAKIQSDCRTMAGAVRAKKVARQPFNAELSSCGDGIVDTDGGEECDGGVGCTGGAACVACQCVASSTTTVPAGTTTTTTIVALQGHCTGSGAVCTSAADCPAGEGCCGNGVRDFGETCDLGTQNCPVGQLCAAGCTASCQLIGRCTSSATACVTAAADCPAGEGCCGNKTTDPGTPETCDDGNTVDGDGCPASCHVDPCTPVAGSSFLASVRFTPPGGTTISGLGVFVDYPEGKVSEPIITSAFGVSGSPNDLGYGFNDAVLKLGGLPTTFLHLNFKTCQDATLPAAGDFSCKVTDASDDQGNVVDPSTVTCAVTVP